jgi:RNA polymerase sigma-B factor
MDSLPEIEARHTHFHTGPLPGGSCGVLLTARNDLNHVTAANACHELLATITAAAGPIVIDLDGAFVSAAGVRALLKVAGKATTAAMPLMIIWAPPWQDGSAAQLGLSRLPLYRTLGAALADIPGRAPCDATLRVVASDPSGDLDQIAEQYARDRQGLAGARADYLREQIIGAMLPFADRLARRHRNSREPADDLAQVARLGLVKAVDRYDPERGSFTAFAVTTITGELKRHFRDHTWGIHVPRRLQDLTLAVTQVENALAVELGRRPTDAEVAARCEVDPEDFQDARRSGAGRRPVSLSLPVGESGGVLGDLFGRVDTAIEAVGDQVTLRRLIPLLPVRERHILLESFYGNRAQADIAADLGISQMHVSRLLSRTLGWLRAAMLSDEPPPWGAARNDGEAMPVVAVRRQPSGVVRVVVSGEVDRDNADRLRQPIVNLIRHSAPGSRLEIHLGGVPLLDAAGVAVLLAVHEAARVRSVDLTAVGLQPSVRRIAVIAGLGAMLAPEDSAHDRD